jgi:hypothetical protein
MVREASLRKKKYEAKIDADVQRSRILALKESMVEQQEGMTASLATLETELKRVVEGQATPVFGHQMPAYLNVARELWSKQRKFSGKTVEGEYAIVLDKWFAKGLNKWILRSIGKLFGITYLPS